MRDKTKSVLTTHCYLEKDGSYLMLHRIAKKNDVNKDKWIGVGGHFEEGESPEECLCREVYEETGYQLISWKFRGIVTFTQEGYGTEYMCLYTSDEFTGTQKECDEGELEWVPKEKLDDSAYIASSANISVVNTVACKATVEPRNAADIITRVQISDFGTVHAARHRSCVRPRNAADIS